MLIAELVKKDPNNVHNLELMADIENFDKKYKQAAQIFEKIININKNDHFAIFVLARIWIYHPYAATGRPRKKMQMMGLNYLEKINTNTNFSNLSYLAALRQAYVFLGLSEKANNLAGRFSPTKMTLEQRADYYFNAGKYAEALPHLLQLLKRNPNDALINQYIGFSYMKMGDESSALEYFLKTYGLGKQNDKILLSKYRVTLIARSRPSINIVSPRICRTMTNIRVYWRIAIPNSKKSDNQVLQDSASKLLTRSLNFHFRKKIK